MTVTDCRCGRATATVHPCHAGHYTCTQPARQRWDATTRPVYSTWACDGHWTLYVATRPTTP